MPHFTVMEQRPGEDYDPTRPQVGKRFFYKVNKGVIELGNTVINYEVTLRLSLKQFEQMILDAIPRRPPTSKDPKGKYHYHLEKGDKQIDRAYFLDHDLHDNIGEYTMSAVAVAANPPGSDKSGNILIVFEEKVGALVNEVCISLHIAWLAEDNPSFEEDLRQLFVDAQNVLDPDTQSIYALNPSDDFPTLGYSISGNEESRNAYRRYERLAKASVVTGSTAGGAGAPHALSTPVAGAAPTMVSPARTWASVVAGTHASTGAAGAAAAPGESGDASPLTKTVGI